MQDNDLGIKIELKVSPEMEAFLKSDWPPELGYKVMQAVDYAITRDTQHFRQEWQKREPSWKPLTPKWVARKIALRKPVDKWIFRGASMNALTTPVRIVGAWSSNAWRHVKILENAAGRVRAIWEIRNSPAGGPKGFWHNNKIREWVSQIMPGSSAHAQAVRNVRKVLQDHFRKFMGRR